jgi:uncharacterized repeat protein (TIGR03803 family)
VKAKTVSVALTRIFAMTAVVLMLVSSGQAADEYEVLHKFFNKPAANPIAALVADSAGNFYGTTVSSSIGKDQCGYGCGVVFKLTHNDSGNWSYNIVHAFRGVDGALPGGSLVFDSSGNLYGTTAGGGAYYRGTVFMLSQSGNHWKESILHSFGGMPDGERPQGALTFDQQGNLYGVADGGGTDGHGAVFELKRAHNKWKERVLHSFNGSDGDHPSGANVVVDSAGNLYSTTIFGGQSGYGLVYELSPSTNGTWKETVLHSFSGGTDGGYAEGGVVLDTAGNLYGATDGSPKATCGTIFELTPSMGKWVFNLLHTFDDGCEPSGPLTFGAPGSLYGMTRWGGDGGVGIVFSLSESDSKWNYTVVHSFNSEDGAYPFGGLAFDQQGIIYGTTSAGGSGGFKDECQPDRGCGVVFSITP